MPEGDEANQPDQPTVDEWPDDENRSRIDVRVLVAHSSGGDVEPLRSFADRMVRDGVDDIVTDMLFNTVGGLIVAADGSGYFVPLAGFFRRRFGSQNS